jgi:UDP-glucose 4-epimerase
MTMSLAGARVLLTGASGCVGAALWTRLAAIGADVVVLTRSPHPTGGIVVADYAPHLLASQLQGQRFDVVFHVGAAGVKPTEQAPRLLVDGNIAFTVALLESLAEHPPHRILFTSSSAVYAPQPGRKLLHEDHAIHQPPSVYGAAKRATEWMGQAVASQRKLPWVSLRLFGVYGPGEAQHRLLPSLVDDLRHQRLPALTAGEQERDWIYVDDVVDALMLAATVPLQHNVYNVCSGLPVSVRSVVETMGRCLGVTESALGLGRKAYRSDEPFFVVGDPSRFHADTGFAPKTALVDGIRRFVDHRTEA